LSKAAKSKPFLIVVAFIGAVVIALGVAVFAANYRPAPSEATKKLAVEAKAIYELDIQLAAVGRLGMNNSLVSRIRTMGAELQDYATNQKHVLHNWFTKNNVLLEDVTVPENFKLTLTGGYVQRLVNRQGPAFDSSLNIYLDDLESKLADVDTKIRYAKKPIAVEFKKTKSEVSGIKDLIN